MRSFKHLNCITRNSPSKRYICEYKSGNVYIRSIIIILLYNTIELKQFCDLLCTDFEKSDLGSYVSLNSSFAGKECKIVNKPVYATRYGI